MCEMWSDRGLAGRRHVTVVGRDGVTGGIILLSPRQCPRIISAGDGRVAVCGAVIYGLWVAGAQAREWSADEW